MHAQHSAADARTAAAAAHADANAAEAEAGLQGVEQRQHAQQRPALLQDFMLTLADGESRRSGGADPAQNDELRPRQRVVWSESFARDTGGAAPLETVQVDLDGRSVAVLPLWIAVHQPQDGGPARVHESTCPVDDALVERLTEPLHCLATVEGLAFSDSDRRSGPWRNYFVGVVGAVAADENDVLWPNQVLHKDRVMWNLRSTNDMVRFLADATSADIQEHRDNLQRLQAERGYHKGWSWHHLRDRWGEKNLAGANVYEFMFF